MEATRRSSSRRAADDHCVRQYADTAALTLDSPGCRWVEFSLPTTTETLPHFLLPLGDLSVPHTESCFTETLMDEQQGER